MKSKDARELFSIQNQKGLNKFPVYISSARSISWIERPRECRLDGSLGMPGSGRVSAEFRRS